MQCTDDKASGRMPSVNEQQHLPPSTPQTLKSVHLYSEGGTGSVLPLGNMCCVVLILTLLGRSIFFPSFSAAVIPFFVSPTTLALPLRSSCFSKSLFPLVTSGSASASFNASLTSFFASRNLFYLVVFVQVGIQQCLECLRAHRLSEIIVHSYSTISTFLFLND
jgi:hypothetical protein